MMESYRVIIALMTLVRFVDGAMLLYACVRLVKAVSTLVRGQQAPDQP